MKILLMISSLGPGGAERVMTLLAEALAGRKHEVCLLTLAGPERDFFPVAPGIRRVALALASHSSTILQAIQNNVRRVRAIRRAVIDYSPDAVLSFMTGTNVLAVLACARLPVRVVVSERIDPASHSGEGLWATLRLLVYRQADALVVQTAAAAAWFQQRVGRRLSVVAIPNPVVRPTGAGDKEAVTMTSRPFILAVGRLVQQKGFDLLIRAFASAARRYAPLDLAIAGEGPEQTALTHLIASLGLEQRVHLLGRVAEMPSLMKQACAFVLSSRYEGFPNVLLEALANGLPVVSVDCPGGPREILADGKYGLLVPCEDTDALAQAIITVATDQELRERLAGMGMTAVSRFGIDRVVTQWEQVLSSGQAMLLAAGNSR